MLLFSIYRQSLYFNFDDSAFFNNVFKAFIYFNFCLMFLDMIMFATTLLLSYL